MESLKNKIKYIIDLGLDKDSEGEFASDEELKDFYKVFKSAESSRNEKTYQSKLPGTQKFLCTQTRINKKQERIFIKGKYYYGREIYKWNGYTYRDYLVLQNEQGINVCIKEVGFRKII